LREENKNLKEEKVALAEEKDQKISELMYKITRSPTAKNLFGLSEEEKRTESMEMMLMDVGEERNKLRSRIDILREELDLQNKENEENINNLKKKFEKENEEKIKKELNLLFNSQQKIMERSLEFVEINEEKLNYYQNLCVSLKTELENIDNSHKKEMALLKELSSSQNKQYLENQRNFYENKIKKMEIDNSTSLKNQNSYVAELEELVKSLINKNAKLETEKQKIAREKENLKKDILKLCIQNQHFQETIEEMVPNYHSHIKKLEHKFIEEKSNLTFEITTLKKNLVKTEKQI